MPKNRTQEFVPIKNIRDGIVIRDDGVICSVLLTSAINFALKSTEEQDAILYQFQNILNALEIQTQIVIQSRKLNIDPYIEYLQGFLDRQQNPLLKLQTKEYINFVKYFTESTNILDKNFFVVVTYSPAIPIKGIKDIFSKNNSKEFEQKEATFEENKFQLQQRVEYISSGLRSIGIRSAQLSTEELVELFYLTFNPGESEAPKI